MKLTLQNTQKKEELALALVQVTRGKKAIKSFHLAGILGIAEEWKITLAENMLISVP